MYHVLAWLAPAEKDEQAGGFQQNRRRISQGILRYSSVRAACCWSGPVLLASSVVASWKRRGTRFSQVPFLPSIEKE